MKSATLRSKFCRRLARFAHGRYRCKAAYDSQQWGLTLREVEQRSRSIAQKRGDSSFQVSASDGHELTVNKLIALAEIYCIPIDQLLRSNYLGNAEHLTLPNPSATTLPMEGSRKSQSDHILVDTPFPDEPTLLPKKNVVSRTPYRRGIIGRLDLTLDPMIPPGSIVQIDTRDRAISSRKNWTHEFQRPVYFLITRVGYVSGWCELDRNSEWLTLIPHPLSPASSRRWKYREEIENLGRVISVDIRLAE
jgi:hypothetical protein